MLEFSEGNKNAFHIMSVPGSEIHFLHFQYKLGQKDLFMLSQDSVSVNSTCQSDFFSTIEFAIFLTPVL